MTTVETAKGEPRGAGAPAMPRQPAPTGSSFYLGLRILPAEQRLAMYAIYAFCREVDDIADDRGLTDRLARLDRWSARIADLYAGRAVPADLDALDRAIRRFALRRADFDAIVAGMAMDVAGQTIAPCEADLDLYCDRVASAPGRLSVRIFGMREDAGIALAHHLGRALQLTNILRDVDEDAAMQRLYLPRERIHAAGIATRVPADVLADPRIDAVCRGLAGAARAHFAEAERIMDASPRAAVRAPRIMAAAYRPVLDKLEARGWAAPRPPVAKRKRDILGAVLRYGFL